MNLLLGLAIFASKLIPHAPGFMPLLALAYIAGARHASSKIPSYTWLWSSLTVLIANTSADAILANLYGYPTWGAWAWFSDTALLTCLIVGRYRLCYYRPMTLGSGLSLGYWLWTNIGVWLTSGLYPQTLTGLLNCFIYALPFLPTLYVVSILSLWLFAFWNQCVGAKNLSPFNFGTASTREGKRFFAPTKPTSSA